jgi:hypothetical protein
MIRQRGYRVRILPGQDLLDFGDIGFKLKAEYEKMLCLRYHSVVTAPGTLREVDDTYTPRPLPLVMISSCQGSIQEGEQTLLTSSTNKVKLPVV